MAPGDELKAALEDFAARANENTAVRKMLKEWTRNIHLDVADTGETFTLIVENGWVTAVLPVAQPPKDIALMAPADTLIGIFRGRLNPMAEFSAGRLKFVGSAKDEMRLDAVVDVIWK